MSETTSPTPNTTFRPATFAQAGLAVDRTERTIRNWLADGKIKGYRVGRRRQVLVNLPEVQAVARQQPHRYGGAQIVELPVRPVVVDKSDQ